MEQQQKVTSTYTEDDIEQNIASFQTAGYLNTRILVKEIQKERQKISFLEKEKELVLSDSELLKNSLLKCDEDTGIFHAQFNRSNEICDSHKKNNDVLDKHIFELMEALNLERQKECNDKKFYDQVFATYQNKWEEYFAMYSKHPQFPQYEEAKRRHIEMKEYLKSSESQLRQLQGDVFKIKCERSRKNCEESKFFPMQNFIIWIAQLRHDTMQIEKEIKETFRDCTELKAKLKRVRSEVQKKSFLQSVKCISDKLQQRDHVHLGNYEQGVNVRSQNLPFSIPPLPTQPKMTQTVPKLTVFIPKLTSVTSVSNGIFSSQQSDAGTCSTSFSPSTDANMQNSSHFRQSTPSAASVLKIPPEYKTQNVPTNTSMETSVLETSFYAPSQDSRVVTNVLKNDGRDVSSTKSNVSSVKKDHRNLHFSSSDIFSSAISSINNCGVTCPLNREENTSEEIKKESQVSPYFLGTPKSAVNTENLCSSSSTFNQEDPSNVWKQCKESIADAADLCSSKTSTSRAVTTLSSRALSPFDIKKHLETLEEMKKSPIFGYKSRSMYPVGLSSDKTVNSENGNNSSSSKHEIMESQMFCSSLFRTGTATEQLRIPENVRKSQSVGRQDTSHVKKFCDSPVATASTENSLFSFETRDEPKAARSSVFSLFGDDDTEIPATTTASNFQFNFGPSSEEKTKPSSFKFLF